MKKNKRISFSELKVWSECAYKHKLSYIDGLRQFKGNEYTAFGTAMHHLCERLVVEEVEDPHEVFQIRFKEELGTLEQVKESLTTDMSDQAKRIHPHIVPALKDNFQDYEIFSIEEELYEDISELLPDSPILNFKGFIDLVIKTPDDHYHIIDWKTCSWGWDARRKSDSLTTYQLMFYKHFFSVKHDIPMEKISTHFALLKRTAKAKNVEIFEVSSGHRRISNALKLLKKAIFNIKSKTYLKNRLSCTKCEYYKTQHCK